MPRPVSAVIPDELYEKLEAMAGLLGLSKAGVLKLLLRVVDYREEDDYVVVVSQGVVGMRRIRGFITAREYTELKQAAERAERLRRRLEDLHARLAELKKSLKHCTSALETCRRPQAPAEPSFVTALREHGLLTLAKKYLAEGDKAILGYLEGEDAAWALHIYREHILAAQGWEAKEKKKLLWIF